MSKITKDELIEQIKMASLFLVKLSLMNRSIQKQEESFLSWSKRLSRVELSESEPIVSGISRKSRK